MNNENSIAKWGYKIGRVLSWLSGSVKGTGTSNQDVAQAMDVGEPSVGKLHEQCSGVSFKPGEKVTGKVLKICTEGVYLEIPGGVLACVSAKSFGKGMVRTRRLEKIRVGSMLTVVVRKHLQTQRQLVLDYTKTGKTENNLYLHPMVRARGNAAKRTHVRKPMVAGKSQHRPLAAGTTVLIDGANLIGRLGPEDVAFKLRTVREALADANYASVIFLEERSYGWCLENQRSETEVESLKRYLQDEEVTLVHGESDENLLECARVQPQF